MIYLKGGGGGGHVLLVSACLVEVLQLQSFVRENTKKTLAQCERLQFQASPTAHFTHS